MPVRTRRRPSRHAAVALVVAACLAGAGALLATWMLTGAGAPTPRTDAGRLLQVVATCFGIAGAAAPTLQLRRILATQSARDVSLLFLLLWTGGCVTGILVGTMVHAPAIWLPNVLALVTTGTTLATAAHLRFTWRHYDALQAMQVQDAAAGVVVNSEVAAGFDPVPLAEGRAGAPEPRGEVVHLRRPGPAELHAMHPVIAQGGG